MRIDDVVRMQGSFEQRSKGKSIAEKTEFNVIEALMGKIKGKKGKGKNKAKMPPISTAQANPAYNLSLSSSSEPRPPMWDGFWTKREPTMSDEEIHNAHKELALEYADKAVAIGNSGKSRSMIADELLKLNKWYEGKQSELMLQYVSVVSPDRKAAYAKTDFTTTNKVCGNELNNWGESELMSWTSSGWGWSIIPTAAEMKRMQEFMKTHFDTLNEYEAEHGQIPYVGQYTNRVITHAPVKNYL